MDQNRTVDNNDHGNQWKGDPSEILAEIITIGDEILIGQIVDTNSAWMGQELNKVGIRVHQISSVSDNRIHIREALDEACKHSQIILLTGGLGPTKDDITKSVLSEYFEAKSMVVHEPTLRFIENIFVKRGYPMVELNRKQAEVPDCCKVIPNTCGTAPGMWFERNGCVVVSMPGVPREMKELFPLVIQALQAKFNIGCIYHQTMMTFGIPESLLAEKIEAWEDALPSYVKLAYLPDLENGVKLRLSAYGSSSEYLQIAVEKEFQRLCQLLGTAVYGYASDTLESVLGELLFTKGLSVATAESCTGGCIAHRITTVPGASNYFKGSVVAYSNEAKTDLLGVNANDIVRFGAVSKEVAIQMAEGARRELKADFAIATTGVAGPGGGTPEKPVGLCWIAVATPSETHAFVANFNHDRQGVIAMATSRALNELRLQLLQMPASR